MGVRRISMGGIDRWFSRGANAISFWQVLPAGALAVLSAYLSTGVAWINENLGAWGWLMSGVLAFAVSSAGIGLLARARLWRLEAQARARVEDISSPFDPMNRVHEDKRLYLRDLAPLGRRSVIGKKFINCEIIGPGTVILGLRSSDQKPWPTFHMCETFDVDCVEIDAARQSALAISFPDCDFEGCRFYHMTMLFMGRTNDTLNWITPDFRQPPLGLEDQSNAAE